MCNTVVKEAAAKAGIRLWQIADALGHTDTWLSRKLRKELPEQERNQILNIIDELVKRREAEKAGA